LLIQTAYPPPRESCVRGADRAAVDKRFRMAIHYASSSSPSSASCETPPFRPVDKLHSRQARLYGFVGLGDFKEARPVSRAPVAEGCLRDRRRAGRAYGFDQSAGLPWLRSQKVPCQFETLPSVEQWVQRQRMTSLSAITVFTGLLRHLKQTGPGVPGRSKSDSCATTAVTNSAILRPGPRSGPMSPLSLRKCRTSITYMVLESQDLGQGCGPELSVSDFGRLGVLQTFESFVDPDHWEVATRCLITEHGRYYAATHELIAARSTAARHRRLTKRSHSAPGASPTSWPPPSSGRRPDSWLHQAIGWTGAGRPPRCSRGCGG